ncbi:MAG: 50S ribosomal protein L10 [archaeon]
MTNHTKSWRLKQFEDLKPILAKYKVLAIGDLNNFPSALLQKLKKKQEDVLFKVTSKSVLKKLLIANNQLDLIEKLPVQPILILANKNAFELYSGIKKSKARSKAKVGMISPIDIIVPAGDTGLPPGPALADLKKVGLKVMVKGPTIQITDDCVICKEGSKISSDVVSILSKLGIKPVELILNVVAAKEDNLLYLKDVLDVDSDEILAMLIKAINSSINLGVEIGYASNLTIEPLIRKAYLQGAAIEKIAYKKGE